MAVTPTPTPTPKPNPTLNPTPTPTPHPTPPRTCCARRAVATALSEGEARRKHVVMVEILGQQVRRAHWARCSGHAGHAAL